MEGQAAGRQRPSHKPHRRADSRVTGHEHSPNPPIGVCPDQGRFGVCGSILCLKLIRLSRPTLLSSPIPGVKSTLSSELSNPTANQTLHKFLDAPISGRDRADSLPEAGEDVATNGFTLKNLVYGSLAETRFPHQLSDTNFRPSLSFGSISNTHLTL